MRGSRRGWGCGAGEPLGALWGFPAPRHHLSVLSPYFSFINSPAIHHRRLCLQPTIRVSVPDVLAGTVSFTHAVAALIRCFAVVTVARADPQLVNRGHATLCTFADVGAVGSLLVFSCQLLVGSLLVVSCYY
jgi:hypothetical protein